MKTRAANYSKYENKNKNTSYLRTDIYQTLQNKSNWEKISNATEIKEKRKH